MSLHTRNRRSAAIGVARPWMVRMPLADGNINQADSRHVTFSYSAFNTDYPVASTNLCPLEIVVGKATAEIEVTEAAAYIEPGAC